jgi:WD40 repeat protein
LSTPPLANALVNLHAALTATPAKTLQAHTTRVTGLAFSPTKDLLATCGMDGGAVLRASRA